jgi:uncharacterized protein (TIGR02099 family)
VRRFSGWLVWVGGLLLAVAVLAGAGWWFLLTQIVPKIDQWRTPLMQQASKALGVTVHIGRVIGQNEGLQPTVLLEDVRLLDEAGRPALQLPRINARLSLETLWPTSLWRQEVHMDRLVLVQPQLDVRRDAQGRLHVAGLILDPAKTAQGDSRATDWLLDQALIRIEGGAVTWTDEMRPAPPLQLSQVDVELRNRPGLGRRVHHWTLAATPPASFGQRFEAVADLTQPLWARPAVGEEAGWQQWLGELTQPGDWHNWSGRLDVKLPHVDVSTLQRHASLPIEVQGGRGRVGLSLVFERGRPQDVGLNVDVQAVSVKLGANLQPLAFKRLSGELHALHQPTRTSLGWKDLTFTTEDGLNWPASQAQLQWQHPAAPHLVGSTEPWLPELQGEVWKHTTDGQFDTDRLDLALLAKLADRLPLSDGIRQQLARLNPLGVGQDLKLTWSGPVDAPITYEASGQLSGISWQAGPQNPGLAGAAVSFKANQKGGKATLAIKNGWAEFTGAFEEPRVPLDDFKADVSWTIEPPKGPAPSGLSVEVSRATFANADAEGTLNATWHTGPGTGVGQSGRYPGSLLLKGHLSRAQGNRVWRYLPQVMLADARHYVRDAVKGGYSKAVDFEVRGDLWHFPFKNNEHGLFRITVKVEDATLDYVPRAKAATAGAASPTTDKQAYWPAFHQLKGDLIFEGPSLRVENATAKLGETGSGKFELREVKGRIDDLDSHDPVLLIEGAGTGPLDDLLKYVAISPVGQWTGQMLGEAQGIGQGSLSLALNIPLKHVVDAKVKGQVSLVDRDQATLKLSPNVPPLQNARGQITFTQDTLNVNAHVKVWGQDVQINGSRDTQGVPRFVANGSVSAEGLRTAQDWPSLAKLAQHMSGQTAVSVTVALPRAKTSTPGQRFAARPELVVSSNLQGLALDLPAPLNKEAMALWPLKVVHSADEGEAKTDTLLVEMGGPLLLKAEIHRDVSGPQAKLQHGSLLLTQSGTALPTAPATITPPTGMSAQVSLPALDVDAWQTWLTQFSKGPASSTDAMEAYLPRSLSLKAGTLSWRQRTLKNISVEITHPGPEIWRAQVDSSQVAGLIEWRPDAPLAAQPAPGGPTDRLVAHLTRLSVPAADAQAFEDQAAEQMLAPDPTSVPALDIIIDQFEWRGLPLGKLEVTATNRVNLLPGAAPLPEWRLTKLRLSNADAQLNATGNWAVLGAQQQAAAPSRKGALSRHRAAFSFTLDLANSGGLLSRLGLPQTLKGGKGKMAGQVAWLGSPLEPDASTMNGDINVAISEGQFLKADPGVAKLLGVLSLQSLPRRLILDFRDVFQQGFAFDRIDGDLKITQGVANTRNLRMRGVQALVLMEGQADLARETQNLRVFVVPEINAGTASLAYAAINPAIGLGTFIAQVLLRKAVVEATTREFTITGPWADPQVEQVQRTTVPAAADEPASGPAGGASTTPAPGSPGSSK